MDRYNNYIDDLMRNYPLSTDSVSINSEQSDVQFGGQNNDMVDFPSGGFPPIYICSDKSDATVDELSEDDEKKKREYSSHKTAVSIGDIMARRRKTTPFV